MLTGGLAVSTRQDFTFIKLHVCACLCPACYLHTDFHFTFCYTQLDHKQCHRSINTFWHKLEWWIQFCDKGPRAGEAKSLIIPFQLIQIVYFYIFLLGKKDQLKKINSSGLLHIQPLWTTDIRLFQLLVLHHRLPITGLLFSIYAWPRLLIVQKTVCD